MALNKCWCPNHFTCAKCDTELINMGFIELEGKIYCESDYEQYFAPKCSRCSKSIVGVSYVIQRIEVTRVCLRRNWCGFW